MSGSTGRFSVVNFDFKSAQQLALDIRSAHQAIDNALADVATLAISVIVKSP
jgi:predicted P-loop ATPase/GTPase